jgi:hypothetical protein
VDTVCIVHIFYAAFWTVFDSLHGLRLTEVSLPREDECLPLNWFQFYLFRLSSDDVNGVMKSS